MPLEGDRTSTGDKDLNSGVLIAMQIDEDTCFALPLKSHNY